MQALLTANLTLSDPFFSLKHKTPEPTIDPGA
jgi:hypothetical protein